MKKRIAVLIFLISQAAYSCKEQESRDGNIIPTKFEVILNNSKDVSKRHSSSYSINGFQISGCSSDGSQENSIKVEGDFGSYSFRVVRESISIGDIGFSMQILNKIIQSESLSVDEMGAVAVIFGNGANVKLSCNNDIAMFLSDGSVADDFVLVVSRRDGRILWLNPKMPFAGKGSDLIRGLMTGVSIE